MSDRYSRFSDILGKLGSESRHRIIPAHRLRKGWLDLCSNDYMGLSHYDAELRCRYDREFGDRCFSASASRLLALDQDTHILLEAKLEDLYGNPALVFNSGYHANTGIVSALNLPDTLFIADKLVHASMIDGLVLGRCDFKRFPHNDIVALERILQKEAANYATVIVMVESIYSMDGDKAPLREIAALRDKYDNMLFYVDEAHGFGVRGESGLGLCEEYGLLDRVDILMGTLGKAAYSAGAFCITKPELKDFLINTARSFIFSTALPPANIAWSIVTIDKLITMSDKRRYLREISSFVRRSLDMPDNDTPIVPWIVNSAQKAIKYSERLMSWKILALPIRKPTVPAGQERIRFSLNASLCHGDIEDLIQAVNICRSES